MTALVWDQIGERRFETGVDRGVLYPHGAAAVVWNGLTSVEDASSGNLKSFYLDGLIYLNHLSPGDYSAKLKAFTYPVEFDLLSGISEPVVGLAYHNQPAKSFGLSYRTRVGNDVQGLEYGYKIHILYNLIAKADDASYDTLSSEASNPIEFSWTLTGTPPRSTAYLFRPTCHISLDSTRLDPDDLLTLENTLYGTVSTDPAIPLPEEIADLLGLGV